MDTELQNQFLAQEGLTLASDQSSREYIKAVSKGRSIFGYSLIFLLLFGGITTAVVMGGSFIDVDRDPELAVIVIGIACAFAIFLAVVLGLRVKPTKWVIGHDGVNIYNGDKLKQSFPIESYHGSDIVRHYTNGIYTGTTRSINMTNAKGRNVSLSWPFAGERFSEAVESICEIKNYGGFLAKGQEAIDASNAGVDPTVNKIFELPQKKLGKAVLSSQTVKGLPFLIVLAIIAIGVYSSGNDMPIILPAIFIAIGGIFLFVYFMIGLQAKKKIPGKFEFREDSIIIDGEYYLQNQIKRIVATPVSFSVGKKGCYWIKIRTINKDVKFCLGRSRKDIKHTYSDYNALVETIRNWALRRGLEFQDDLT